MTLRLFGVLGLLFATGCYDFSLFDSFGEDLAPSSDLMTMDAPPIPLFDAAMPRDGSRCATVANFPTTIACTGFEGGSSPFNLFGNGGMAMVDPTFAYRGQSSVHFLIAPETPGANADAQLDSPAKIGSTGSTYVRAFFYMQGFPSDPGSRLLDIQEPTSDARFMHVGVRPDGTLFTAYQPVPPPTGTTMTMSKPSATKVPKNAWFCLELEVDWGTPGGIHVLLEDAEVSDLAVASVNTLETTDATRSRSISGLYYDDPAATAVDVWMDELMVSSTRIRCAD